MSFKTLSMWFTYLLFFVLLHSALFAQKVELSDAQLTEYIKSYVDKLLTRHDEQNIEKERFLVQQIRMINQEIKARVGNVSEKRTAYFDKLQNGLAEIKELKERLPASAGQLYSFIDDLSLKMEKTIDNGIMDYKRQQIFDDAIQLLYLAEELLKLNPQANLNNNPEIASGISKAKKKIVNSFGSQSGSSTKTFNLKDNATVFDVYKEWRRTQRIKYHVRLTDVQVMKKKLSRNATVTEFDRMFKREMQHAAQSFNFKYFELAALSFEEIFNKYQQVGMLDDVLFYMAESNYFLGRFNKAEQIYKQVVDSYPSSALIGATYKRLVEITSHFERYDEAVEFFKQMQTIVSTGDNSYDETLVLAVDAALKGKRYEDAVTLSYELDAGSSYINYARFIQAKALSGAQNYEEAVKVLNQVVQTKNLEPEFRFDVLAKLGYLSYELGDPAKAINHFNEIGPNYSNFDRVLMGYAWSYYKIELDKLIGLRNFDKAKKNLTLMLENFPNSEYILEARTLLGYINQLEFDTNGAIENFRYSYKSKEALQLSNSLTAQQQELQDVVKTSYSLERKAIEQNNAQALSRAINMREKVEKPLFKLKYSDLSPVGMASSNQINKLRGQLKELDRLMVKAQAKNDDVLIERIEDIQLKIYRTINSYPTESASVLGFNYFDEHPLARKESIILSENEKLKKMREDSFEERRGLTEKLAQLDVKILNAKSRKDYRKLAHLEISKERFQDLLKKLDYVDTWTYSLKMRNSNINLQRWSDYGAFGLANVNFAIRNLQKEQIGQMREQIQRINDLLMKRKEYVVHKINQIDSEITLMTRRVRRQERIREREELNRQFEDGYFDTHESEAESSTTAPPSFDEEEDATTPPAFDEETDSNTIPPALDDEASDTENIPAETDEQATDE